MAISLVQTAKADYAASPTATFSSAPTEGNLLVCYTAHRSGGQDASLSGWTKIIERDIAPSDSTYRKGEAIFAKIAGASESQNVSPSWSSGASHAVICHEFSPGTGRDWDAVTGAASASGDDGSDGLDDEASPTGTTASTANQLGVVFGMVKEGAGGISAAITWSMTGYTFIDETSVPASFSVGVGALWQEFSTTAARGGTLTIDDDVAYDSSFAAAIAVFGHSAESSGTTYNYTASGGSTTAGAGTIEVGFVPPVAGGAQASGAASVQAGWSVDAVGGAQSAGAAAVSAGWAIDAAGGVQSGGVSLISVGWSIDAVGGAQTGGVAAILTGWSFDAVGGAQTAGAATIAAGWVVDAAGGAVSGGAAVTSTGGFTSHAYTASGGAQSAGAAAVSAGWAVDAVGGVQSGGVSIVSAGWSIDATGGATPGGQASWLVGWIINAAGGAQTAGAAVTNFQTSGSHAYEGQGGAQAGGVAGLQLGWSLQAIGAALTGGAATTGFGQPSAARLASVTFTLRDRPTAMALKARTTTFTLQ